jgi:hypothetical protein
METADPANDEVGELLKPVSRKETLLKIKGFPQRHFETEEYNSIWSRKCGT